MTTSLIRSSVVRSRQWMRPSQGLFQNAGFVAASPTRPMSSCATLGASANELADFDVIVVGGGHAGCEAAAASARTGARTALVTQRLDTIGELSCNPSMGGIGKGHLVKEIDALGGIMGRVADEAGIHYRMLNRRKGPAVRGPRAQMDRDLYKDAMQAILKDGDWFGRENLHLIQGSVEDLLLDEGHAIPSLAPIADPADHNLHSDHSNAQQSRAASLASDKANLSHRRARIRGVIISQSKNDSTDITKQLTAKCVVITTGTFLRGVLMIGHDRYVGGRHLRDSDRVEPPSIGLAKTLERFGFPLNRLKTGTPPRLDGRTIHYDLLVKQPSENPVLPFGHLLQYHHRQPPLVRAQTLIDCYQSRTNEQTHRLVQDYAHLLPKYDGLDGQGNGPRYCPSIHKKVQRFPDRLAHNSFLEPEGLNTNIVYPNGMSGPYPEEIQLKIMRTMIGLHDVEIVRPGYDVEYDFVNPTSLTHVLETKTISGLYLAGQICGTTGYEEAAAQGIVAGANAGRASTQGYQTSPNIATPLIIGRDEGYIGVLIDDLVTRGTMEPYRMFTSRAEYRISLRADNADLRLTPKAIRYGLVQEDEERAVLLFQRQTQLESRLDDLAEFKLFVTEWAKRGGNDVMGGAAAHRAGRQGHKKSAEEILGMPHVSLSEVERIIREVQTEQQQQQQHEANDDDPTTITSIMEPSPASIYDTVEATIKYKSYAERQHKDMESWRKAQGMRLPPDLIYTADLFPTMSSEEIEKLNLHRPSTFAQASQISGLTPQSLVYLYHFITRRHRKQRQVEKRNAVSA